jgi:hypothetical protein
MIFARLRYAGRVRERTGFGFNELHAEERGLLLGLSLQAMGDAALSRLASSRRQACRDAWQALRTLSRSDRAALLADWIVEARAPFPPGMERLHPSWLAEAIAGEPAELWPALLCGLPGRQAVEPLLELVHRDGAITPDDEPWPPESVAELQRCVFGRLAPLCVGPAGPVGARLCRLGCEELLTEIAGRGSALRQELCAEGDESLWAVAGRVPATLGRRWVKW